METVYRRMRRSILLLLTIALPWLAKAQAPPAPAASPNSAVGSATTEQPDLIYTRPTQKTKLRNYFFDTFGPYPIAGAALAAGINQADNSPPEWRQGAEGYGKRFGSNFGIAAVSTTTRYAMAQAFREDTLYYRCQCKGFFPRLGHAAVSTLTARSGDDGHSVFSVPSLVAPYAGTMTAVYARYPGRYNAEGGLRMGNYTLLGYVGGNIGLEFLSGGPHTLLSRFHLRKKHGAADSDPKP
jgi:hypothetical protein